MTTVIRTDEEVTRMILNLEAELGDLPNYNAFGDSNASEKMALHQQIRALQTYLDNRTLPANEYDEVRGYLTGAGWSTLATDYE